jgi:hypothetical protein
MAQKIRSVILTELSKGEKAGRDKNENLMRYSDTGSG